MKIGKVWVGKTNKARVKIIDIKYEDFEIVNLAANTFKKEKDYIISCQYLNMDNVPIANFPRSLFVEQFTPEKK